jgi:hypothetical protein
MKKIGIVLTLVMAVSISLVAVDVFAGWNSNPASDPAFTKFLEDTADIRKEMAIDRAELDAVMAGENPDPTRARELSTSIAENQEKLSEIARANDIGAPGVGAGGGCGNRGGGRGSCGSCGGAPNGAGPQGFGGNGSCGSPGCPNAVPAQ